MCNCKRRVCSCKPTTDYVQMQSDWKQTDSSKPDFILNKPLVVGDEITVDDITIESIGDMLQVKDEGISTDKIADGAITTIKLAPLSVSAGKIQDFAISTAKMQNASVTNNILANDSVSLSKLQDNSVNVNKLGANAVSTIKVIDNNITLPKIEKLPPKKILGNVSNNTGNVQLIDFLDEDDMISDSDTGVPSQSSVKAYVDNKPIPPTNLGSHLAGTNLTISSSTGTPTTASLAPMLLPYVPKSTRLTINEVSYDLSESRAWTIPDGVPIDATIKINGETKDLKDNPEFTLPYVESVTTGEPTGSDVVSNMVSLTQAEYTAGVKIATTFYIITDA